MATSAWICSKKKQVIHTHCWSRSWSWPFSWPSTPPWPPLSSRFSLVEGPACLFTCGFLWNTGPGVYGVGPHSNGPVRPNFVTLLLEHKRSFFWKWVFLEHSGPEQPQNHPAAAPGHRTHRPRTKKAQICPQTPRGRVLAAEIGGSRKQRWND